MTSPKKTHVVPLRNRRHRKLRFQPVPRRATQSRYRSSGTRPNLSWSRTVSATFTSIAAATSVIVANFELSNQGIDEVLLRTRGMYVVKPSVGVDAIGVGAFGFAVVTDAAFTAGAASIPGPVTEASDDVWFMWQPLMTFTEFKDSTGEQIVQPLPFDSKAKRVVETGRRIVLMVENAHATQAFTFGIGFSLLSQVRGTR